MKVELESGVWLKTDIEGDPGRTLVEEEATEFDSIGEARAALSEARKFRPFEGALIIDSFL